MERRIVLFFEFHLFSHLPSHLCLIFSFISSLIYLFHLSSDLSLSVSLWPVCFVFGRCVCGEMCDVVLVVVVVVCVWCVFGLLGVVCAACLVWHAEKPCVDSEGLLCVHSKRLRAHRQNAHALSMWAFYPYTRRRFECTYGERFESTHGGQGFIKINTTWGYHLDQRFA